MVRGPNNAPSAATTCQQINGKSPTPADEPSALTAYLPGLVTVQETNLQAVPGVALRSVI